MGYSSSDNFIYVSKSQIDGYLGEINEALDKMSRASEETLMHGNMLLGRARVSLENAKEAMELMNKEYDLAQQIRERNNSLYDSYIREREEAQRLLSDAENNVITANSNRQRAENSQDKLLSAGSNGDVDGYNAQLRVAGKAISDAKEGYERAVKEKDGLNQLVNSLQKKCDDANSSLISLDRIIAEINESRNKAQKYYNEKQEQVNALESKLNSFSKASKKLSSDVDSYKEEAKRAREYIEKALQCLSEALGERRDFLLYSGTIEMYGTDALDKFTSTLDDSLEKMAGAFNEISASTRNFEERLTGDVRDQVVNKMFEIRQNIEQVSKSIESACQFLDEAKEYLKKYLSLSK